MRRDMDLIRLLLFKLEDLSNSNRFYHIKPAPDESGEFYFSGYVAEQVEYHLTLLRDAGFVEGGSSQPTYGIMFRSLTWDGQDFLDSVRDATIWARTKEGAAAAGGFTVGLLKELAKGFVRKLIEEKTGIKL